MISPIRFSAWALLFLTAGCSSTGPEQSGAWGSDQASLVVTETGATLQLLASQDCYGSYGTIEQPISSLSFSLSGTYTQLMGVYPGHADYPAQFTGSLSRGMLLLSVEVPALQRTLGPFALSPGVTHSWPACLYPVGR
ncbi:MAG TPA: hypothetical protein VL241_00075 [Gemmatimonadales bacterium]|nr:hypothetical protein [Gemmatimonadales bacterium]